MAEFEPNRTLPGLLLDRARSEPDAVALRHWRDGNAYPVTWRTYRDRVRDAALGLVENGVRPGDRVAVMSSARPEWIYAALAVQSVGGVVIGVYPTNTPAEIEQLLIHSEAVGFVGEATAELDKVAAVAARTPALRLVVGIDAAPTVLPDSVTGTTWDDLSSVGARRAGNAPDRFDELVGATTLDAPAVLFYTSGSTGAPKGVAHTHRTLQHAVQTIIGLYPDVDTRRHDMVGFLPLAHVAPALLLIFTPLLTRLVVTYCRIPDYEDVVRAVRPTALLWPPRFYEKAAGELIARAESFTGLRRHAYRAAMGIGRQVAERRWRGRRSSVLHAAYRAALRLIFLPLRATIGMDRIRVAWTASAPMPENVMALWQIWGLDLRENYGLTETAGCPVGQFDQPFPRPGLIGRAFSDPRYRVDIAADGEMLIRAPLLFREYWRNPDETDAVLRDGWFRTGDLVERTTAGEIRLIGRKKDIIITSGGKTINPQPIETRLKESSLINEAIIVGDGRKYLTVLLEPSVLATGLPPAVLAERLREELQRVNADLARVQQLKSFRVLPRALDAARGERTSNGKIKRNVVVNAFSSAVNEMYDANDGSGIAKHARSRSC